jgi:hypothetical protein
MSGASMHEIIVAARAVVREALDSVEVHPCDEKDDAVRARSLFGPVRALHEAIAQQPQPSTIPADAPPEVVRAWKDGVKHGAWLNTPQGSGEPVVMATIGELLPCYGKGTCITRTAAGYALPAGTKLYTAPPSAQQATVKLTKPAKVGNGTFHVGVAERHVIEAAQRAYERAQTPEGKAERAAEIERAAPFLAEIQATVSDEKWCGNGCDCLAQCGDVYAYAKEQATGSGQVLTDEQIEALVPWKGDPKDPHFGRVEFARAVLAAAGGCGKRPRRVVQAEREVADPQYKAEMDSARAALADAKDAERYRTLRRYATGNAIEQMLVQSIAAERTAREFDASVDVLILARRKSEATNG